MQRQVVFGGFFFPLKNWPEWNLLLLGCKDFPEICSGKPNKCSKEILKGGLEIFFLLCGIPDWFGLERILGILSSHEGHLPPSQGCSKPSPTWPWRDPGPSQLTLGSVISISSQIKGWCSQILFAVPFSFLWNPLVCAGREALLFLPCRGMWLIQLQFQWWIPAFWVKSPF